MQRSREEVRSQAGEPTGWRGGIFDLLEQSRLRMAAL